MNITIRPIEYKDAADMAEMRVMKGVIETTNGIPSENITFYEEELKGYRPNEHGFVAVDVLTDGTEKVVGWCSLFEGDRRHRNVGSIGLFVRTDYQGQGIGKKLLATVLDVADNWLMLHRVELDFLAGNVKAQQLYESFGFIVEGVKKDATISEGKYVDLVIMGRIRETK